jgi:hypothetical protein
MSKETFDKFYPRYQKEKTEILKQLENSAPIISNLTESIGKAVQLSAMVSDIMW